ncbi:LysM peptidoglycan-binding domain-containing protein, partial [Halopseudomonas sp.]|uniref:LysM peptidoglycan-binding domain-containing protein n=1 Tax=Halopseudomonas sp. TaxID=2901191 RepID=UPI0030025A6E
MRNAAGNQVAYRYVVYQDNGTSVKYRGNYTKTYEAFDGYKESVIGATWTKAGTPGKTIMTYTSRGELVSAVATGGTTFDRKFASNAEGQLIARREKSGKTQSFLYYDGANLANFGNVSTPEISDTYTPISKDYPAQTPGNYVVNQGDTLEGIASTVWGDAKMWYLIADANGLDPAVALTAGSSLKIPNVVTSNHNDA